MASVNAVRHHAGVDNMAKTAHSAWPPRAASLAVTD